ncbi:hypothetical protein [Terribacillus saccharophilus]|uniref:ABC-2 family transporter protein n=1 Tax=Terribacillus saccharophilus TaxID=361277 RepID=A0A268A7Q6_9BACI|nr:hypothetical protein [Terribacillus saccharophilus]PAD20156.1 hypothetical protein CHH64_15570 [Terribacillus saccharophilus]
MLAVQFQRLLHSKFFYISILIGSIITILHYIQTGATVGEGSIIPESAYLLWMNSSISEITDLFLMLLPILAVMPFSTQLIEDKKTNYHLLMIMRTSKKKYLFTILITSSVAGFLAIVIPIVINFFLFTLTFPAIPPDPFIYYTEGLFSFETFFYNWQLNYPLIHSIFYIFLSGLVGSVFAIFSVGLCLYFRFTLIVLAIPIVISLLFSLCGEFLELSLSPINFLDMSSTLPVSPWSVFIFCSVMCVSTLLLIIVGGRKLDK